MNQKNITELILKMSLSTIPPSLQEHILSNLDKLQDEDIGDLIVVLDSISAYEEKYLVAGERYVEFYNKLSKRIKSKLIDEAKKIQEELVLELKAKKI